MVTFFLGKNDFSQSSLWDSFLRDTFLLGHESQLQPHIRLILGISEAF